MRNKIGSICMVSGTVLVLAALFFFVRNLQEARCAEKSSQETLIRVIERIQERSGAEACLNPYDPSMTEVEIQGDTYIGYLSIPSIGVNLPVMADWDYTKLQTAACCYSGTVKTDDFVIAAHNYITYFGSLSKLMTGDEVCFFDMDGGETVYEVAEMDTLPSDAVEEMTAGEYDLTLFTCTYDGKNRVTVRCDRKE